MGWTVAVGMVTSLPFLVFSGPITDSIGHMNVIVIGNIMNNTFIDLYIFEKTETEDLNIDYIFRS